MFDTIRRAREGASVDGIRRMRRVWVIGIGGSGKTTLAAELARRLGVPHIELDAMHHGPDWAEPDLDQFRGDVAGVVAGDGWVVDGGYQRKLGTMVPEAADTLIWLDLPLHVSMLRTARRSLSRVLRRAELWNGNRETLGALFWGRESLLWWSVKQHRIYEHSLPELFASPECADKRILRLRSAKSVRAWLATVPG
jgi:adenylate kinase family enzyme